MLHFMIAVLKLLLKKEEKTAGYSVEYDYASDVLGDLESELEKTS